MNRVHRILSVLIVVCFGFGCSGGGANDASQERQKPTGPVLTDQVLGVQLAQVSEGWRLADTPVNAQFALQRTEPEVGLVTIELGAADLGTNLVDAVRAHQEDVQGRLNGVYQGGQELGGPLGRAYYSRGRYDTDAGATEEETAIFTLNPANDAIIVLRYRYPAGEDSAERIQSLFDVLANIEALPPQQSAEAPQGDH
jgi:hypothetical protein